MNASRWLCAVLVACLFVRCAMTRAAEAGQQAVDPAVVGTWRTVLKAKTGSLVVTWTIEADGHYVSKVAGPGNLPGGSGHVDFANGSWRMRSDIGRTDQGRYILRDPDTMTITGAGGAVGWSRVADGQAAAAAATKAVTSHPAPATVAAQQVVDPALVGSWRTVVRVKTGMLVVTWRIDADGHYVSTAEGPGNHPPGKGHVEFANGSWSMRSESGRADQGSYKVIDRDSVSITGAGGPVTWSRVAEGQPAVAAAPKSVTTQPAPVADAGQQKKTPEERPAPGGSPQPAVASVQTTPAGVRNGASAPTTAPAHAARELLTPEQQKVLAEAKALGRQVWQLFGECKYAEAIQLQQRCSELVRSVLGEGSADYATSLRQLASLYIEMCDNGPIEKRDYTRAEMLLRQALQIDKQVLGESSHAYANDLGNLGWVYIHMGDAARADPLCNLALNINKRVISSMTERCNDLANNHRYAEALKVAMEAVDVYRDLGGATPKETNVECLEMAGRLNEIVGNDVLAETLYREATDAMHLRIFVVTPDWEQMPHDDNKPNFYHSFYGYDDLRHRLAQIYKRNGDYAKAMSLYLEALGSGTFRQRTSLHRSPEYAMCLNDCGDLYERMGDLDRAQRCYTQAIGNSPIARKNFLPARACAVNHNASISLRRGDIDKAEEQVRTAMDIRKAELGEDHPDYAESLMSLAMVSAAKGDIDSIDALCRQAIEIRKRAQGEIHSDYLSCLVDAASLYLWKGDSATAARLSGEAVSVLMRKATAAALGQSERRQLTVQAANRGALDLFLSTSVSGNVPAAEAYAPVLAWKGAVSLRQKQMRELHRIAPKRLLARAFIWPDQRMAYPGAKLGFINHLRMDVPIDVDLACEQIRFISARVATMALMTPDPDPDHGIYYPHEMEEMFEYEKMLERWQEYLASASDLDAAHTTSPAELLQALPADVALVDFVQYVNSSAAPNHQWPLVREARLAAFVLRPHRPIQRIELGPTAAVADLLDRWQQTRVSSAGAPLKKLVWDPLTAALEGAKTVLIAPDGPLIQLPFAALPATEPGHYLIEEREIAIVTVPQALPELLSAKPVTGDPSILLMGGVDYGQENQPAAAAATTNPSTAPAAPVVHPVGDNATKLKYPYWPQLQGTQEEVDAIRQIFHRCWPGAGDLELSGTEANAGALPTNATAHRFLHLATHGFSDRVLARGGPPKKFGIFYNQANQFQQWPMIAPTEVIRFHPALRAGLVLAGANRVGGILTAMQVEEWDMENVELVTLSACETALGQRVEGDGLLGLQRAFQVAGARTVVASLWSANDEATKELMVLFYQNLWQKKMGKLAALREAQIELIREGNGRGLGRGVQRVDAANQPLAMQNKLPPYFWAEFVLSGDWR